MEVYTQSVFIYPSGDINDRLVFFPSVRLAPLSPTANRLQRWALILLPYDFKIVNKQTNDFGYVDALSRLLERNRPLEKEDFVIASVKFKADCKRLLIDNIVLNIGRLPQQMWAMKKTRHYKKSSSSTCRPYGREQSTTKW